MEVQITHSQKEMSSLDLLEIINTARIEAGESEVRRNQFTERCIDELDGDHYKTFVVNNQNGTTSEALMLTQDQCMLIGMRESKAVRRNVLAKLKAIEAKSERPAAPAQTSLSVMEILQIAMTAEQGRLKAIEERDQAIETKALIGSKREATAMLTASQAVKRANKLEIELDRAMQYASVKRMEMLYHGQQFSWRHLKSVSAEMGIPAIDIFDANYGTVKAYHQEVWHEAYAISITTGDLAMS